MVKREMEGEHDIELNSSMRKAGPSQLPDRKDFGLIAVRQVYPSNVNKSLGKILDPENCWEPTDSFERSIKEFSDMIPPFLWNMGVPKAELGRYIHGAKRSSGLRHAWVAGMADPTGCLPPGHVFITGFNVTRPRTRRLPHGEACYAASRPNEHRRLGMARRTSVWCCTVC